ncbi:hypothetical protein [Limobrevibacterium gyesilva]|uniref:Uncharacterized protein n=1 Tax=Limobrevibacterium gyesilva TaxID=2991712 RepID=A0AA41YYR2_9PROT|nr:hypothetical protein [Limobrevibacterium gyesilva]MCW3477702.1 hypothetical protein [Limobrevibacterium gyesilva]
MALDRERSATHHRSGGSQSAHQGMIDRRFTIVSSALPSDAMLNSLTNEQGISVPAA